MPGPQTQQRAWQHAHEEDETSAHKSGTTTGMSPWHEREEQECESRPADASLLPPERDTLPQQAMHMQKRASRPDGVSTTLCLHASTASASHSSPHLDCPGRELLPAGEPECVNQATGQKQLLWPVHQQPHLASQLADVQVIMQHPTLNQDPPHACCFALPCVRRQQIDYAPVQVQDTDWSLYVRPSHPLPDDLDVEE